MNLIFEKIKTDNTEQKHLSEFNDRIYLSIKAALWLSLSINIIYFFVFFFINTKSYVVHPNLIFIITSCLPTYYFIKVNKIEYAKFFAIYPAIFSQIFTSYLLLKLGFPQENAELIIIPYAAAGIVFFKYPFNIISVLINILLYSFIKITKYQLYPSTYFEFFLDLAMSFTIYLIIVFLAYYYRKDFLELKQNNDQLYAQKQIIESQTEILKQLDTTKNRLFSIISHDLRSPLAALKNIIQLLNNQHINSEEFTEISKRLQQNVDVVYAMLENLLLWSLSQMEGIKPKIQQIDLNELIEESISLFTEIYSQKQINLNNRSSPNLLAYADEHQLQTVIRNLLNNAIKFTPINGKINISGRMVKDYVNIKISDSGIGIKKDDLQKIFSNPKINSGTAGEKGTGFGLFLCKELIEKNGGNIAVSSEFGKGTSVEISLPVFGEIGLN